MSLGLGALLVIDAIALFAALRAMSMLLRWAVGAQVTIGSELIVVGLGTVLIAWRRTTDLTEVGLLFAFYFASFYGGMWASWAEKQRKVKSDQQGNQPSEPRFRK